MKTKTGRTGRAPGAPLRAESHYAVLFVPDFALHALRRSEPSLTGRPVALVAGEGRKAALTEVSPEAAGVEPGLPATVAMARCPGIVLRTRDPAAETEAQRLVVAAAFTLSPRVEATAAGCCTIDLRGADAARTETAMAARVAELRASGLPACAGAGPTPLLAAYAAHRAEPVLVVRDAREFLRDLPLATAEPTPEQHEVLRNWGVKTLGGLTALAKAEIGRRLGTDGVALWERAAGEATRVLRLVEPARSFVAEWIYEPPVDTLEPLAFKLQRYAERVALELRGAGLVAEALALTLLLEDERDYRREFRLPEPGADPASWLRVLLSHLETVRLDSRLAGARLAATPARPPQKQDGLFDTGLRDPAAFWENLARLGALLGNDRVGTPVLADTHRPDAFALEKPPETVPAPEPPPVHPARGLVLRRFRPPTPVRVTLSDSRPTELAGDIAGTVRRLAGPWRADGDWWRTEPWEVETWQVELGDGVVYQLAHRPAGWDIEGVFD